MTRRLEVAVLISSGRDGGGIGGLGRPFGAGDHGWSFGRWNLLRRRLSRPDGRFAHWYTRTLIALPGVALLAYGLVAAPSASARLSQAVALPFLLHGATLPLWRRTRISILRHTDPMREVLRRRSWRISAASLFAASASLICARALAAAAALPRAGSAAGAAALGFLAFAAVPPVAGFLVQVVGPTPVRRTLRTAELIEELDTSLLRPAVDPEADRGTESLYPPSGSTPLKIAELEASTARFDPALGASGRPPASLEYAGGEPGRAGDLPDLTGPFDSTKSFRIRWAGTMFVVEDPARSRRIRLLPAARAGAQTGLPRTSSVRRRRGSGRRGFRLRYRGPVAEMVWFEARSVYAHGLPTTARRRSLLFLDDHGYCVLEIEPFTAGPEKAIEMAEAGGVRFAAYSLGCPKNNADEIRELMFPDRWNCVIVTGQ